VQAPTTYVDRRRQPAMPMFGVSTKVSCLHVRVGLPQTTTSTPTALCFSVSGQPPRVPATQHTGPTPYIDVSGYTCPA
jgi:hypothetical protein